MRKILINIGERSKQAFAQPINTYKKNKVLSDYLKMIKKNKHLILRENKKDVDRAIKIKLRDNLINRLILNENKILDIIINLFISSTRSCITMSYIFFSFIIITCSNPSFY